MSSGVGGLPANNTPATWPSGHHFKERFHATALIMRGFLDGGCGWSDGPLWKRVAPEWKDCSRGTGLEGPGKGKESVGLLDAARSDR